MSIAHLHLAINHFPVIGSVFVALLFVVARYRHSDELARVGLWFAALVAVASIAVYFTGEPAESLIERLPGFSEQVTERHEDAALIATIIVGAAGALALVVLATHRGGRSLSRRVVGSALGLALLAVGVMGYTAYLGGQVRHTEIRAGGSASSPGSTDHDG